MTRKIKSLCAGSYLVMYAVALVIWQNFLNYLSFFTAYNAAYTSDTADAAIKAITDARNLPDASARRANSKKLRKLLRESGKRCCNNFLILMSYVEKAFPANEVEAMKQLAGYANYLKAGNGSIIIINALNTAALAFVNDHSKDLAAAGMPDAFVDTLTGEAGNFAKLNTDYTTAVQTGREDTNAKTAANNAVYLLLTSLMKDAKIIFMNDATTRKFFTYDAIAVRFKKEGKTGFRFTVKASDTKKPIGNTTFLLQPGNITTATNKKGIAVVELQKDVIYSYTATTPGFYTVTGANLNPTPGVMSRKKIFLIAIPKEETA